jgi:hypothetical protein
MVHACRCVQCGGMSIVVEQPSRWPAVAAASFVTVFCVIAGGAVVWNLMGGSPLAKNAVVALALVLRMLTVAMALASVQGWGRLVPPWLLSAGLWGAAAVQLAYPIAETVVKALILVGAMEPIDKGISNMTAEGWFNFGATWVIWGIPGTLFLLAARSYSRRVAVQRRWVALGLLGGVCLLVGLGALIG